jgi:hypothetical protein
MVHVASLKPSVKCLKESDVNAIGEYSRKEAARHINHIAQKHQ